MDYTNVTNEELENLVKSRDMEAICELGDRLLYGKNGQAIDYGKAYRLFTKGEARGVKKAYKGLADMYQNGWYVVRNEEVARDYYQKAGEQVPPIPPTPPKPTPTPHSSPQPGQQMDLQAQLDTAEQMRADGDYTGAKQVCMQVLQMTQVIQNGSMQYSGNDDLEMVEANANWTLAYIAFNMQQFGEMDNYIMQKNVLGLHPWSVYLQYVAHMQTQASSLVMEQDLTTLNSVRDNPFLTQSQRGDIYAAIGEMLMEGYGKAQGFTPQQANDFFKVAAEECGNSYAQDQLR